MKTYVLKSSPASAPSVAQLRGAYWATWKKLEAQRPGANRFAITHRVLGYVRNVNQFSAEELGQLIAEFRRLLSPEERTPKAAKASAVAAPLHDSNSPAPVRASERELFHGLPKSQGPIANAGGEDGGTTDRHIQGGVTAGETAPLFAGDSVPNAGKSESEEIRVGGPGAAESPSGSDCRGRGPTNDPRDKAPLRAGDSIPKHKEGRERRPYPETSCVLNAEETEERTNSESGDACKLTAEPKAQIGQAQTTMGPNGRGVETAIAGVGTGIGTEHPASSRASNGLCGVEPLDGPKDKLTQGGPGIAHTFEAGEEAHEAHVLQPPVATEAAPASFPIRSTACDETPHCGGPAVFAERDGGPVSYVTAQVPGAETADETDIAGPVSGKDAKAGAELTEWQLKERNRRLAIVTTVEELKRAPHNMSEIRACKAAGVDNVTYGRWRKRYQKHGLDGLAPGASTGRPSQWRDFLASAEVCAKLDTIYLATMGASCEPMTDGRRTAKIATTLYRFAEEPECPALLAEQLRNGSQPAPIVRYLRRITPEIEARYRGEKSFKLHGFDSRRDQTVRLPDGQRAELLAGFMVELDDMSVNQPFWCPTGEPAPLGRDGYAAGPEPTILSRQGLYARDVKSGRWLGVELIARPREAYRAEDILRFLRRLMMAYGKFDVLRLERGIWRARSIKGYAISDTGALVEEEFERPAMAEEEKVKLQDGLEAIGVTIQYVTSAHRKGGIESGFNYLQTILATYTTEFVNIGRHAGEFEVAARRLRQQRAGSRHPNDLGFAPIDELADRVQRSFDFINRKPREKKPSPDNVWDEDMLQRQLLPLTDRDLAAFLPVVREVTIDGGRATTKLNGQPQDFRADVFAELGSGYRVFLRYDPTEPTLGAAIYNRESPGNTINHFGLAEGQFICFAHWECPGPQIDLPNARGLTVATLQRLYGNDASDDGYARRKAQEKFVRTSFRALPRVGLPPVKTAEIRKGNGDLTRTESGSLQTATPPMPPQRVVQRRTLFPPPPARDAWAKQQQRLQRQAEQANRLQALTTD